jgi:thioredoxin
VLHRVTDKNYDEIIGGASVALLDFVSAWCSTCKHLEGIIEELSRENNGRVLMAKVDISESPAVTQRFGVMGIPTVVFLCNGKPVHQVTFTGVVSKEKISQMIEQHLGV